MRWNEVDRHLRWQMFPTLKIVHAIWPPFLLTGIFHGTPAVEDILFEFAQQPRACGIEDCPVNPMTLAPRRRQLIEPFALRIENRFP